MARVKELSAEAKSKIRNAIKEAKLDELMLDRMLDDLYKLPCSESCKSGCSKCCESGSANRVSD